MNVYFYANFVFLFSLLEFWMLILNLVLLIILKMKKNIFRIRF
jgi:hypothetical protein